MPDTFVVTTPATTVAIGGAAGQPRTGQVAFTVSNIAGRPMRTRLRPVPQDPAQAQWFAVSGGEERLLALGATETFTVAVTVPPDVPAGSYTFRADAIGEDSPDEDFQTGPTVSLTVAAAPAKARFPWWMVAVAAAVVIIGVAVFVFISRSGDDPEPAPTEKPVATVTVPATVGSPTSAARASLEAAGLVVKVAIIDTVPPVQSCDRPVLISVPQAGEVVDAGSTVTIGIAPASPLIFCLVNPNLLFTDLFTLNFSS